MDKKDIKKIDLLDDHCPAISTGDMTGLIPAGITDEEEIDSYEDIYRFLPPGTNDN